MRGFDDEVVDAVVVGTGAGGSPLLATLASRGLRVVALEAGPHHDATDHTPDETDALAINWMEERVSGGAAPVAFGQNNSGFGVGGSTLHWGAFAPRPDADDLCLRTTTGEGVDWPIPHAELVPYLQRVEAFVGVSGPADYPWDPGRRYGWAPPARNASSAMMVRGCAALGIRATDAPAAVLTADHHQEGHGLRQACVGCGACHQGCRNGAKTSMDTTYLPLAVARGAEVRAECRVVGFERDRAGAVTAVVYRRADDPDVDRRQRCRSVVLAAGGVETPRLLLHAGLGNASGQVGHHFMAHGGPQVWARFDTPMRSYRGWPSSIITEDFRRVAGADFAAGYLIQSLGVMPLALASSFVRGGGLWGQELVDVLDAYPHLGGLGINAECLPYDGNRLTLSQQPGDIDAYGVPRARVDFSPGANEDAIDRHAIATMTAIVEAAGGRDVRVLPRTAHTIGTARMGTDPEQSVVDPDGRSHDVPNLWICDNSVFPSSLIANPALTIMALSLRTAERFLARA